MKNKEEILTTPIENILMQYPYARDWLNGYEFPYQSKISFYENAAVLPTVFYEEIETDKNEFADAFYQYLLNMELLSEEEETITQISILPGKNKSGEVESFASIDIQPGQIVSIVGPTGSGKSQLLADIEWGANGDTPTGRKILFNQQPMAQSNRYGGGKKIIAQLSQNMNFVVDLTVQEFLEMHAACWVIENKEKRIQTILTQANQLAGEQFSADTHVTNLSGGQSRALMIADCAFLSTAPVVLIDEIENAGINRKLALKILTGEDKIVLMATHDPILALMADFRLIIQNGGIKQVIHTDESELATLEEAQKADHYLFTLREKLRNGMKL
jgi:ABC-type lipoprotein export system ATPase subunit